MDSEQFDNLITKLLHVQYHKSKGLISISLLEKFVHFIEAAEEKLKGLHFYDPQTFTIRVTLAPQTTEKAYDTIEPIVGYCGPYTAVHYENGQYRFERFDNQRDWYQTERMHDQGARFEIEFTKSPFVFLGHLYRPDT